jgi:hypothetical protein
MKIKKLIQLFIFLLFSTNFLLGQTKEASINIDIRNPYPQKIDNKLFGVFLEYLQDYVNGPCGFWAQEFLDRGFDIDNPQNTNIGKVWYDTVQNNSNSPSLLKGGYNPNGRFFLRINSKDTNSFAGIYQSILYNDTCFYDVYVYYKGVCDNAKVDIKVLDPATSKVLALYPLDNTNELWQKKIIRIPPFPNLSRINILFSVQGKGYLDLDEASCIMTNAKNNVRAEWAKHIL